MRDRIRKARQGRRKLKRTRMRKEEEEDKRCYTGVGEIKLEKQREGG